MKLMFRDVTYLVIFNINLFSVDLFEGLMGNKDSPKPDHILFDYLESI